MYLTVIGKTAGIFIRLGFSPLLFTLVGFFLSLVSAIFLWTGHLIIGGLILFFAGFFDSLDGAVARGSGKVTRFGALLDSTLDRYAEFSFYIGFYGYLGYSSARLVWFFQLMAIFSLVGSIMVSYVRARSESIGIPCSVGFWQRPERVIALGTAAILTGITNPIFINIWYNFLHDVILKIALIGLAIGTNFTAFKRLFHAKKVLRERGLY